MQTKCLAVAQFWFQTLLTSDNFETRLVKYRWISCIYKTLVFSSFLTFPTNQAKLAQHVVSSMKFNKSCDPNSETFRRPHALQTGRLKFTTYHIWKPATQLMVLMFYLNVHRRCLDLTEWSRGFCTAAHRLQPILSPQFVQLEESCAKKIPYELLLRSRTNVLYRFTG